MSGRVFLCGTADRCEKHNNRPLHGYPCYACMEEWAEANPRTSMCTCGVPGLTHESVYPAAAASPGYEVQPKEVRCEHGQTKMHAYYFDSDGITTCFGPDECWLPAASPGETERSNDG